MPVATVGETATNEVSVTEERIEAFAELSGDENPIHLDDEYAAETMFGGCLGAGLPASTTRLADTDITSTAVAVSTGVNSE